MQIASRNRDDAYKTLEEAKAIIRLRTLFPAFILKLAYSQALIGDIVGAKETANQCQDWYVKTTAFLNIAQALILESVSRNKSVEKFVLINLIKE